MKCLLLVLSGASACFRQKRFLIVHRELPLPTDAPAAHDFAEDIAAIAGNTSVPAMLEAVCAATGLRFSAVARVTNRRWITCSVVDKLEFGLRPGDELVVESTICHEVRDLASEIVIDDVLTDPQFCDHHTPKAYGFRSYLSIPILRADGSFFGTLCALDPEPNRLKDSSALAMIRLFAKLIGDVLVAEDQIGEIRRELEVERQVSGTQEEFMAIVAHDLRNPVAAIGAGLRMLRRKVDDEDTKHLVRLMEASTQRMSSLVNNLMDHARNRLGGGIVLDLESDSPLTEALQQIIEEFRAIAPDRQITVSFEVPLVFACDPPRVAQLLSNLIANAMAHGAPGRPIEVVTCIEGGHFILSVKNEGEAIPAELLPHLFKPFHRGAERSSRHGLGLGLHIASEIARAHGGKMTVKSGPDGTVFSFEMPLTR